MEKVTDEYSKQEIPSAKIYDVSNAERISWEFENCGWRLENLPTGSLLIIPTGEI